MIDIRLEEPISLAEAAKLIPTTNGKTLSIPTVWRWCRKGLQGHRLEYLRGGRRLITSREAVLRFMAALAEADADSDLQKAATLPAPSRTARQRERAVEAAESRLTKAGC